MKHFHLNAEGLFLQFLALRRLLFRDSGCLDGIGDGV